MADRYYQIPDKPVYNTKIREIQNSDPVNASMIVNPVLRQLLENIAAVKELADSALRLAQPRKIGNANFDGSANITLEQMGAAASSHTHQAQTSVSGNAGTATKLQTARKIGNANFDGSANITLEQMGAAASSHTHPAQTDVTGNAGTANKWKTARKINGLSIDGSADRCSYAVCSTAAGTAAKVVDCSGFILVTGAEITVKFTVTNTAANPTLNVAGTGAKPVYYRGAAVAAGYLAANHTYTFRYNGAQYELVGDIDTDTNTVYTHPTSAGNKHIPAGGSSGQILRWSSDGTAAWGADNNTTYGNMKAATASSAGAAGLVPAPAAGAQTKYLRGDGTWQTPPDTNTVYNHPTTAGNKHIPVGGSSGKILKWSADGTAEWGDAPVQGYYVMRFTESISSNSTAGYYVIGINLTHVLAVEAWVGNAHKFLLNTSSDKTVQKYRKLPIGNGTTDVQIYGVSNIPQSSNVPIWFLQAPNVASPSQMGGGTPTYPCLIYGARGNTVQTFHITIWYEDGFAWNTMWN